MGPAIRTLFFGCPRLLASFSWKGLAAFLAFTAALALWTWSGVLFTEKSMPFEKHAEYFLSLLQRNLLTYFGAYLLVTLADGLPHRGTQRRIVLAAALVIGVLLSVQARCAVVPNQQFYVYGSVVLPYCSALPSWSTYVEFPGSVITPLAIGAMVMVVVFGRRRDAELVAALHKARASQVEAHRQRIESDIEAMQSRVDPDVLFRTLAEIRARYETSAAAGEGLLDELIGTLREAARSPAIVPAPQAS